MPLSGIKVVDMSRIISGPFSGMILADFGAEVIKVEAPSGDASRVGMLFGTKGENPYFVGLNRNKRSVVLNLKTDEGKEVLLDMVKDADALIENFRPGVMERLGLGYEELAKVNPGLIYASISGYGLTGPYVKRPAFDFTAQALTGFMSLNGDESMPPLRSGPPISDNFAGLYIAFGILAALRERDRTGKGQAITVSLIGALMSAFSFATAPFFHTGQLPPRTGNDHMAVSPYGVFQASDGPLAIAPSNVDNWEKMVHAFGRPDLLEDPRFATNSLRRENRKEINAIVEEILKAKTRAEWIELLNQAGVPAAPINNLKEAFEDPQILHEDLLLESPQPGGAVKMVGFPLKMTQTPAELKSASPQLGQHTREVLAEMGYEDERIDRLLDNGAINEWDGQYDVDRLYSKKKV
jgi:CoA:oxalate CoA-transferase